MKTILSIFLLSFFLCSNSFANTLDTLDQLRSSCELEDPVACFEFANNVQEFELSKLYSEAENALNKSCELNHPVGCYAAFYAYNGKIFNDNPSQEQTLYYGKKACELNISDACLGLGLLYSEIKDFKNTEEYYTKACNLDSGRGCAFLASYVLEQKQDYKVFEKYAYKGCKLHDSTACLLLSNSKKIGLLDKPDMVESVLYLKEACKFDNDKIYTEECKVLEGLN